MSCYVPQSTDWLHFGKYFGVSWLRVVVQRTGIQLAGGFDEQIIPCQRRLKLARYVARLRLLTFKEIPQFNFSWLNTATFPSSVEDFFGSATSSPNSEPIFLVDVLVSDGSARLFTAKRQLSLTNGNISQLGADFLVDGSAEWRQLGPFLSLL